MQGQQQSQPCMSVTACRRCTVAAAMHTCALGTVEMGTDLCCTHKFAYAEKTAEPVEQPD